MTEFLIKSTVAMGVLLGLYHILFEREKMHRFNRFYLLGALVFALTIPFITVYTFIEYVEVADMSPAQVLTQVPVQKTVIQVPANYWPYIGWGLYILVSIVMLLRFAKNIFYFIKKAHNNPKKILGKAKLILLEEKILPHTFLNYIFMNREEYEAKQIEEELYTHEYAHVKQKHTFDILFVEALRILFWFNPLLYFYKKAIHLNHEFLADGKVLDTNKNTNTVYYQTLLLSKAQNNAGFALASQLTFSLTKKRLIMMTKTTSTIKAGLLKLAILPAVTALMMLLCTKTVAQETKPKTDEERLKEMIVPDKVFDSLKKANPDMFSDDLNIRYKNTKFTFKHKDGTVTEVTGYKSLTEKQKKLVSYAPETYGMDLTIHDNEETTATAKEASKDPYVLYKNTKFKFTYKNGNVAIKTGYKTLTEEDRKKIAPILPALGNKDLVEYTETEKGFSLHQGPQEDKLVSYDQLSATPQYPGGIQAFFSYFNKNYSVPKMPDGTYKMYFSFVVEKDGSLSNIKCLRGDETLVDQAIRVIKKSEKWIPAQKDGVAVRASFNIPITINVKS
ncbi:MAG: hypothetical protein DI539_15830 [Flavobacterium psychrophilum]|nr:MAG: hypothetical protein DI539_15830 [Flavobacterium psychrophilum]